MGVEILTLDKIDCKTKAITKDKEGHYRIMKGSIQKEDITLINTYSPHTATSKFIKQILTGKKRGNRQ